MERTRPRLVRVTTARLSPSDSFEAVLTKVPVQLRPRNPELTRRSRAIPTGFADGTLYRAFFKMAEMVMSGEVAEGASAGSLSRMTPSSQTIVARSITLGSSHTFPGYL